ncbi:MAG: hypothetical protein QXM75_01935 [Candidatus Diapherotrites archaeon]
MHMWVCRHKRNKGQLTLDLLLAFLYLIVLIDALIIFGRNYLQNQNEILVRLQEKRIAYSVSEMLGASYVLSDGNSEVRFVIPKIRYMNKTMPMPCNVDINNDSVKVTATVGGETISEVVRIVKPTNAVLNSSNLKCGEELRINYS